MVLISMKINLRHLFYDHDADDNVQVGGGRHVDDDEDDEDEDDDGDDDFQVEASMSDAADVMRDLLRKGLQVISIFIIVVVTIKSITVIIILIINNKIVIFI